MTRFLSDKTPQCPADLLERARKKRGDAPLSLAVVRASAPLPMETAFKAWEAGIAEPILVGEEAGIRTEAESLGWDLSGIRVVASEGEVEAIDTATGLVRDGEAGALMKGHLHSDVFMGGIVKREAGIRGSTRMVHVFALFSPDGGLPLLMSDGAVNVLPDRKTLERALEVLVETGHALGIDKPKVAIVSATETPIGSIPSSMEAKDLSDWAGAHIEGAEVYGPLSFDLAVSPEAVGIKGLEGNAVAGEADALLFPDIVSGNVFFKALVWYKGACAAGVVTGGSVPIILTSRADALSARMASVALAALLSE